MSWTDTASETVFWDVEMTDETGQTAEALPAGAGRGDTGVGLRVSNSYTVPGGVTRCFRVKARTERGTQGCLSEKWSNRACATTVGSIRGGAGLCLDADAAAQTTNGGKVQVWDCNDTTQQHWNVDNKTLRSGAGKCLDVDAATQTANGAKVQVWDCNGSQQQKWTVQNGTIRSGAGKCLDVDAATQRQNGAKVQVWDCNGTLQQTWNQTP
ncbi:MAG: RICIN domain-containing protein [Acetobacteraceae bacterium]|nr:RICIN domain-containing protein [Acetobacteraceae bacterium]